MSAMESVGESRPFSVKAFTGTETYAVVPLQHADAVDFESNIPTWFASSRLSVLVCSSSHH